jgi:hypothetical protein
MWPAFISLTAADALIGSELPPAGDGWSAVGAGVTFGVLNLLAVVALGMPGGALLRRVRPDLPRIVAKDYAGTFSIALITAGLLAAGLCNRAGVLHDRRALDDATVRAEAYIGVHAPDRFRRELRHLSIFTIQAASIYRACAPSASGAQTYCVVVRLAMPFAQSVSFAGYEPNSVLSQGTG